MSAATPAPRPMDLRKAGARRSLEQVLREPPPAEYYAKAERYLTRGASGSRNPNWTAERLARAAHLYDQGLTAREIASALARDGMQVSRNAVIGALTRSGVKTRIHIPPRKRFDPAQSECVRAREVAALSMVSPVEADQERRAGAARAAARDPQSPKAAKESDAPCQWVEGDPRAGAAKCAAATISGPEGFVWCAAHRARVYRPLSASEHRRAAFRLRQWGRL